MPDEYRIAAAYIRVSTEDQTELSPSSQLVEIRKWAAKNGWIIPDEYVFVDEGISGRKVTGRDAFRHLIGTAKLKPKPFDAILLWKFSRFARNRDDAVFYKSVLRKQLHIEVLSISEPIAEGKLGILMEALIEAMDEYYSINLAEEVKRGMEEKHRRGELQSNPSYGYTVEDNVLIPKEPEAAYIKEIFRRFCQGEGFYPIAKWLNSIGVRTHRGNLFENRTVEYILRNPVYIGKLRWNPSGITRRDFTDPDIVLADGKHVPL
ncbi:recombinase family protein, partial [Oscillibacter sp.]|uniref:recombinase family protein n=1 Tax=Oscillibacter sp. TaxID=1945593 RepID=UPI0028A866CE